MALSRFGIKRFWDGYKPQFVSCQPFLKRISFSYRKRFIIALTYVKLCMQKCKNLTIAEHLIL